MERLIKVIALNDADSHVHYRASSNPNTTLCGMKTDGRTVEKDLSCERCHRFGVGDI